MYPNLKLQLWKCGLRQNRLAKILGIDETALSRIVNGFRDPSLEVRNAIATLLECEVEWLFQAEENKLETRRSLIPVRKSAVHEARGDRLDVHDSV